MDRELARKQPARIIGPAIVGPGLKSGQARIQHARLDYVTSTATRMYERGQVEREYRLTRQGPNWVATVTFLPRRSWLRRNAVKLTVGGVATLAFLAGVAWAVSLVVAAVAAALPIVGEFLLMLGVGVALLAVASTVLSGGRVIEVVQKVKIKG